MGEGPYTSLLVDNAEGASYVLRAYVDFPLDQRVRDEIQAKVDSRDRGANEPPFAVSPFGGTIVRKSDARVVVPYSGCEHPDYWFNSTVMDFYQQLLSDVPHTRECNLHLHPDHISVELYSAWQIGELHNKAMEIANRPNLLHIMSTCYLSIMLINLYSDHWYTLVFYPHLKVVHCLNWLDTSEGTQRMLLRLIHVYLWAHDVIDPNFDFTPSQWSFFVIREDRIPSQRGNGTECGPMTLRSLEYLIAGQPLTFSMDTMLDYRYKILVAFVLGTIPWLTAPGVAMDAVQTARAIREYAPTVNQALLGEGVAAVGETEEEKLARREAKKARQDLKNTFQKGQVDLAHFWDDIVY